MAEEPPPSDLQRLNLSLQQLCQRIQEITAHPHHLIFHRSKCCSLAKSYALGLHDVQAQVQTALTTCPTSTTSHRLTPSLTALYHAMIECEKFIRDCMSGNQWLKKSLTLAMSTEAVRVHLHDLVWCIWVINEAVGQVLGAADHDLELVLDTGLLLKEHNDKHAIYGLLNDTWAETVGNDDLAVVLNALAKHEATEGEAENRLAKFMFDKLLNTRWSEDDADEKLPPCLWVDTQDFRIIGILGEGGYAVVLEVEWLGQKFALKNFSGVGREVFGREAAIHARLQHPNVVQLICCAENRDRNMCGLLMELMHQDLHSLMDKRKENGLNPPFSLLEAVDLMLQIAKGMEYLHGRHIMHRDLKSFNVLVCPQHPSSSGGDGRIRVKIADFGMSKAKHISSRYTTLQAGTTKWRAPEVFEIRPEDEEESQSDAKYTKKADVYSFAIVCYEILTGNSPFDDVGPASQLHRKLIHGLRPNLPSSCPPYLASYIEKCWHGNPSDRPSFTQISRTLRHLKGILLTHASPMLSYALSGRSCIQIEEKLVKLMGANWSIKEGAPEPMSISYEMSCYKVMERNIQKEENEGGLNTETMPARESSSDVLTHLSNSTFNTETMPSRESSSDVLTHLHSRVLFNTETMPSRESSSVEEDIKVRKEGIFATWLRKWKNRLPRKVTQYSLDIPKPDVGKRFVSGKNGALYFTYKEIKVATNYFTTKIGEGGFGSVFHGILANGQAVAVKVQSGNSHQGMKEFLNEVDLLSRVHHSKIVSLIGYCNELGLILVYEYMPKGTLRDHLYGAYYDPLTWRTRLTIALDSAQGLEYLHEGCSPSIIHRDVKSSNILLSETLRAKVADFGLSRSQPSDDQTGVSTVVQGTLGYLDPEYFRSFHLTTKSDVYSFGVVLLEIMCGRSPVDRSLPEEHINILSWVQIFLEQGNIGAIVDPALGYNYNLDSMQKFAEIAMMSVDSNRHNRPTMGEIISALKEAIRLESGYAHVTPDPSTPPYSLLS